MQNNPLSTRVHESAGPAVDRKNAGRNICAHGAFENLVSIGSGKSHIGHETAIHLDDQNGMFCEPAQMCSLAGAVIRQSQNTSHILGGIRKRKLRAAFKWNRVLCPRECWTGP